jgi:hypothetical protein
MKIPLFYLFFLIVFSGCSSQRNLSYKAKPEIIQLINKNLQDVSKQYKLLMKNVPEDKLPLSFEKGKSLSTNSRNWLADFILAPYFIFTKQLRTKLC